MIGALAGTIGGIALVVSAWNGELYSYSVWVTLAIVAGASIAGALLTNVLPRTIGAAAVGLAMGCVVAAGVALFRGHPAWALALVACVPILAGPQITAREVMRRAGRWNDMSQDYPGGFSSPHE